MSEGSSRPRPTATWNSARGAWEVPQTESLLCEHLALFSATWPSSGMTRRGTAYALQMSAPRTEGSGCSSSPGLLPTPMTSDTREATGRRGDGGMDLRTTITLIGTPTAHGRERSSRFRSGRRPTPAELAPLLKTPTAQLAVNGGSQHPDKRRAGGHGPTLADEVEHLLPTPTATPYGTNQSPSPGAAVRPSLDTLAPMLLPTPRATDGTKGGPNQRGSSGDLMLPSAVMNLVRPADAPSGSMTPMDSAQVRAEGDAPKLPPTPTAMGAKASGWSSPSNVTLTDAAVRTSLGATTNPRFDAGKPYSDVPLPLPPSLGRKGSRASHHASSSG